MKPFFAESFYDTPSNMPRLIGDRLFLNSRWYFVGGYISEVLRSRKLALKGLYDYDAWSESSYRIFKFIEGCGGRFHLRGLENINSSLGPTVFISNHMSVLETFIFPCIIGPHLPFTFVVKESLVKHAIFGPVMRSRNPIVVKRINPREDFQEVLREGKKLLASGISVVIFPQSTRNVDFVPEEFNSMGVKLAKAANVPIIPVAIKTDFWGNGKIIKDVGSVNRNSQIHMTFGRSFKVNGIGKDEHKSIVDFIGSNIELWKIEDGK